MTKLIETVQKELTSRYPHAETSPGKTLASEILRLTRLLVLVKSSTATSGSPPPNSYTQRYQERLKSPSPTVNLSRSLTFVSAID